LSFQIEIAIGIGPVDLLRCTPFNPSALSYTHAS